ncbi:MAG: STAS domain-containing protein [Aeromonadales bacterium]|nr:STAS domain-containing protein [Aeromonadales bacterium]MDY2891892.1 STAS domain-containing protein [Succinivibrio sp.]
MTVRHFDKLTVDTVPELWKQRSGIFSGDGADLSGAEIDSAGVAFLVRWAKSLHGGKLKLAGCSPDLLKLISIFELKPLFEEA